MRRQAALKTISPPCSNLFWGVKLVGSSYMTLTVLSSFILFLLRGVDEDVSGRDCETVNIHFAFFVIFLSRPLLSSLYTYYNL